MLLLITFGHKACINKSLDLLEQGYADYFNFTHRRIHKTLDLDHMAVAVDTTCHVLTYYRYIELAPVRLQLVVHPGDYPWSSYGCNAMGEDTGLVFPHTRYLCLGCNDQQRRQQYRNLFGSPNLEVKPGSADLSGH
jgi:putative transposase